MERGYRSRLCKCTVTVGAIAVEGFRFSPSSFVESSVHAHSREHYRQTDRRSVGRSCPYRRCDRRSGAALARSVVVERDDSTEETRRRAMGNLLDDSLRKGSARRVITLEDFTMTAMPAVGAHVAIGAIGVFLCGALPLLYPIFSRRLYLLLCCFRR